MSPLTAVALATVQIMATLVMLAVGIVAVVAVGISVLAWWWTR